MLSRLTRARTLHQPLVTTASSPLTVQMARAAVCLAVLLLAFAAFVSATSDPLTAAQPDHTTTTEEASNLPVQRGKDEGVEVDKAAQAGGRRGAAAAAGDLASLASPEVEGQNLEFDWGKKKKLDDDDSDSDSDSDSDHDSDSDSDSDHDSDSDSDSDHDSDSDSDSDSDDKDHSKNGRKKAKHATTGRKGVPDGKKDDELPKVAIRA